MYVQKNIDWSKNDRSLYYSHPKKVPPPSTLSVFTTRCRSLSSVVVVTLPSPGRGTAVRVHQSNRFGKRSTTDPSWFLLVASKNNTNYFLFQNHMHHTGRSKKRKKAVKYYRSLGRIWCNLPTLLLYKDDLAAQKPIVQEKTTRGCNLSM